jgi:phasin family protein
MAKTNNPFMDMDFTKMMDFGKMAEQFKMPGLDTQALLDAQRKNIEAITAANKLAFEGAQAMARRQAEILTGTMSEMQKAMQELNASGAPEEKIAKQADTAKRAFETAISNIRELAEMGAKSNTEALDVLNKRVSESMEEVKSVLASMASEAKNSK